MRSFLIQKLNLFCQFCRCHFSFFDDDKKALPIHNLNRIWVKDPSSPLRCGYERTRVDVNREQQLKEEARESDRIAFLEREQAKVDRMIAAEERRREEIARRLMTEMRHLEALRRMR